MGVPTGDADHYRVVAVRSGMTPTPERLARLAALCPVVAEAARALADLDLTGVAPVLRFQVIPETKRRGSDNVSTAPDEGSARLADARSVMSVVELTEGL